MKNETVITKGSFECPEILIEQNSCLSIHGNSTSTKPESSYNQLIEWIDEFEGDMLKIDIDLDHVNCRSIRLLSQAIFKADSKHNIKDKSIEWHFKDKEQKELGEMMSSLMEHTEFFLKFKE